MLGLARVGEVLHAMEAALAGAPATCAGMLRGLRLVELAVQERLPDAEGALRDLMTELESAPRTEAETSRAPPAPRMATMPPAVASSNGCCGTTAWRWKWC